MIIDSTQLYKINNLSHLHFIFIYLPKTKNEIHGRYNRKILYVYNLIFCSKTLISQMC